MKNTSRLQNQQPTAALPKRSAGVDQPTREQLKQLEADLWSAADNLRANSDLKSSEYATPVLGLIFLKFADDNYRRHEADIIAEYQMLKGTRRERKLSDIAIEKCGFYLPDDARYEHLLNLPEEKNIAKALKEAMKSIEEYKPELDGVLPKDEYFRLTRDEKTKNIPNQLLKTFANIPADFSGDLFGQIYEYFLAEFARSEGSKGGEFFTPRSVVRLMVEMIEPHGGKVFDPACGSGGMFVQSAQFIEEHRKDLKADDTGVFVYGQEKTQETVNLAKMNLAVNGLRGEVKKANTITTIRTGASAPSTTSSPIRRSMWMTSASAASRRTSASTPMASRATNPRLRKPMRVRKPYRTPIIFGSISLPPR